MRHYFLHAIRENKERERKKDKHKGKKNKDAKLVGPTQREEIRVHPAAFVRNSWNSLSSPSRENSLKKKEASFR
jgi:tetrahydrodipicolinate N-succinyltransferase